MSLATLSPCLVVLCLVVVVIGIIALIRAWGGLILGCAFMVLFALCLVLLYNWFMAL